MHRECHPVPGSAEPCRPGRHAGLVSVTVVFTKDVTSRPPGWSDVTPGGTSPDALVPDMGTSAVGLKDGVQRGGQRGEVAVVDPAVVELAAKFLEQHRPVSTGRCGGGVDLHSALDDPDG